MNDRSRDAMESGVRSFLEQLLARLGVPEDERPAILEQTPARFVTAFSEDLLSGYGQECAELLTPMDIDEAAGPVILSDVAFTSICAHHLLPYTGTALIAFTPDRHHVGLGRLARLVDARARRLTFQERLTARIADDLEAALQPKSLVVILKAEHQCVAARGARRAHSLVTREVRGATDPELDALILRLL